MSSWAAQRRRIWLRDGGVCGFCGVAVQPGEPWHMDHIVPAVKGGDDGDHNRRVAHTGCNQAAGARLGHSSRHIVETVTVHVRLPADVYEHVKVVAAVNEISFNAAFLRVLRLGVRIWQAEAKRDGTDD